jgi:hypothetical protein
MGRVGDVVSVVVFVFGGCTDRETTGEVVGSAGRGEAHLGCGAADGRANGQGGGEGAVRGIETSLDEVLALWLGEEGLEFGGGEGVDEAGL